MKTNEMLAELKATLFAECHPDSAFFRAIEARVDKIIRISGRIDPDLAGKWWNIRTEFIARNPEYLEMI